MKSIENSDIPSDSDLTSTCPETKVEDHLDSLGVAGWSVRRIPKQ